MFQTISQRSDRKRFAVTREIAHRAPVGLSSKPQSLWSKSESGSMRPYSLRPLMPPGRPSEKTPESVTKKLPASNSPRHPTSTMSEMPARTICCGRSAFRRCLPARGTGRPSSTRADCWPSSARLQRVRRPCRQQGVLRRSAESVPSDRSSDLPRQRQWPRKRRSCPPRQRSSYRRVPASHSGSPRSSRALLARSSNRSRRPVRPDSPVWVRVGGRLLRRAKSLSSFFLGHDSQSRTCILKS